MHPSTRGTQLNLKPVHPFISNRTALLIDTTLLTAGLFAFLTLT